MEQFTVAKMISDAVAAVSAFKLSGQRENGIPEELRSSMDLFLKSLRKILGEYNVTVLKKFDELVADTVEAAIEDSPLKILDRDSQHDGFDKAVALADSLTLEQAQMVTRALATYFHLVNLSEEYYRVHALKRHESDTNEFVEAYKHLVDEIGKRRAQEILDKLDFHPVFTAHPTEARRKSVEDKIRCIAGLLEKRERLDGADLAENTRCLAEQVDCLFRTSLITSNKPTPVEEANTIIEIFDQTLFDVIPKVYRRFDNALLGEQSGAVKPICPAFFHPGSWIGSDRDGNPNVTAKVSRKVAAVFSRHIITALANETRRIARDMTLGTTSTPPSEELSLLWMTQVEMSETLTDYPSGIWQTEPHRAVLSVMAARLDATAVRNADCMYENAQEFLDDLFVVQRSLVAAGCKRMAYGALQNLIWQTQTFGFHMVEMEFRQHSVVHTRALEDIEKHGLHGERGSLEPMTREVLDTFRAMASIQRRNGEIAARRYIVSFTKSAEDIENVYKLCRLAFSSADDVPTIEVIPLFEQLEDLENSVSVLTKILEIPAVQDLLAHNGRKMEIMLGYSDSSKDAGPTTATLALHAAQERIADWAEENNIHLTLFHGRGGAVGRGGGPANKAVLAQPRRSVNCRFKLTEQGEVIFARYGNRVLARRHVESMAAAILMHACPSVDKINTTMWKKYTPLAEQLNESSHKRYLDLLNSPDFASWFSTVTPLTEVGLLPIGSRPAKRGLGAKSLDDLRTIPWVFAWSQARINLAAWYGLGTACESCGDLEMLRSAYKEWPLFTTFIDNIEMSLAKTNEHIAKLYLSLGDRDDLSEKVLEEMRLTRKWVLDITQSEWPLQRRRVLGRAVRIRTPYVDALSVMQATALRALRKDSSELSVTKREDYVYLILCTVSGIAAGLQNTG